MNVMTLNGVELRRAAHMLQQQGVNTGERKLIAHLVDRGAIRKTLFGYEVTPDFRYSGKLITQVRQARIETGVGRMAKDYTVVLVTGDGLSWLRDELTEQAAAATH